MQFLDTVTIYHKTNDGYERKIVKGCYWYGNTGVVASGQGIVRDDAINVFFPVEIVKGYKIHKGDRIIKGEAADIISVNELNTYEDKITVLTVQENIVNSPLDNILVTGK